MKTLMTGALMVGVCGATMMTAGTAKADERYDYVVPSRHLDGAALQVRDWDDYYEDIEDYYKDQRKAQRKFEKNRREFWEDYYDDDRRYRYRSGYRYSPYSYGYDPVYRYPSYTPYRTYTPYRSYYGPTYGGYPYGGGYYYGVPYRNSVRIGGFGVYF